MNNPGKVWCCWQRGYHLTPGKGFPWWAAAGCGFTGANQGSAYHVASTTIATTLPQTRQVLLARAARAALGEVRPGHSGRGWVGGIEESRTAWGGGPPCLLCWQPLQQPDLLVPLQYGSGTANTALAFHHGRILALHEADLPYVVSGLGGVGGRGSTRSFSFIPSENVCSRTRGTVGVAWPGYKSTDNWPPSVFLLAAAGCSMAGRQPADCQQALI